MAGGYVVFEDKLPPTQGAPETRYYWQGSGSNCWGAGAEYRASAALFADQHAARAALAADGEDRLATVGYEWVPGEVVQPDLFAVLAAEADR